MVFYGPHAPDDYPLTRPVSAHINRELDRLGPGERFLFLVEDSNRIAPESNVIEQTVEAGHPYSLALTHMVAFINDKLVELRGDALTEQQREQQLLENEKLRQHGTNLFAKGFFRELIPAIDSAIEKHPSGLLVVHESRTAQTTELEKRMDELDQYGLGLDEKISPADFDKLPEPIKDEVMLERVKRMAQFHASRDISNVTAVAARFARPEVVRGAAIMGTAHEGNFSRELRIRNIQDVPVFPALLGSGRALGPVTHLMTEFQQNPDLSITPEEARASFLAEDAAISEDGKLFDIDTKLLQRFGRRFFYQGEKKYQKLNAMYSRAMELWESERQGN